MSIPRFSLRAFFVAVAYFALVITAAIRSTHQWADAVFNVSLGIILVGTSAAFFITDSRRTFWRGFCLFAWIYMFLAFAPMERQLRDRLITDRILAAIQPFLGSIQAAVQVPGFERQQANESIGHSAWTIFFGVVGGYIAVCFSERTRPSPATQ